MLIGVLSAFVCPNWDFRPNVAKSAQSAPVAPARMHNQTPANTSNVKYVSSAASTLPAADQNKQNTLKVEDALSYLDKAFLTWA